MARGPPELHAADLGGTVLVQLELLVDVFQELLSVATICRANPRPRGRCLEVLVRHYEFGVQPGLLSLVRLLPLLQARLFRLESVAREVPAHCNARAVVPVKGSLGALAAGPRKTPNESVEEVKRNALHARRATHADLVDGLVAAAGAPGKGNEEGGDGLAVKEPARAWHEREHRGSRDARERRQQQRCLQRERDGEAGEASAAGPVRAALNCVGEGSAKALG